jgi:hypothetical protein
MSRASCGPVLPAEVLGLAMGKIHRRLRGNRSRVQNLVQRNIPCRFHPAWRQFLDKESFFAQETPPGKGCNASKDWLARGTPRRWDSR